MEKEFERGLPNWGAPRALISPFHHVFTGTGTDSNEMLELARARSERSIREEH